MPEETHRKSAQCALNASKITPAARATGKTVQLSKSGVKSMVSKLTDGER
jgi:hypothetical protein